MEAITLRMEAITTRVEAIAIRFVALRIESFSFWELMAADDRIHFFATKWDGLFVQIALNLCLDSPLFEGTSLNSKVRQKESTNQIIKARAYLSLVAYPCRTA